MTIKKTTQSLNVDDTTPNPPTTTAEMVEQTQPVAAAVVEQTHDNSVDGNEEDLTTTTAFCVKCKAKHIMENPQEITLSNGKTALKGICQNCKKTTYKLTKKKKKD